MKTLVFLTAAFSGTLVMAQGPSFNNVQQTTGMVGLMPGQSARLNVLYPSAPAPILQVQCSAVLTIRDDQGNVLKSAIFTQLGGGSSVSLTVNGDTDLHTQLRTELYGLTFNPGCRFVVNLEIIDNATQKTLLTVGGQETYPIASPASSRGVLLN